MKIVAVSAAVVGLFAPLLVAGTSSSASTSSPFLVKMRMAERPPSTSELLVRQLRGGGDVLSKDNMAKVLIAQNSLNGALGKNLSATSCTPAFRLIS